jgi:hypothetical protein
MSTRRSSHPSSPHSLISRCPTKVPSDRLSQRSPRRS